MELFLALSILTLLGSFVLVRAKPMLDHYRYQRAVSQLKQEIDFTRRLSRTASADIEFHIAETKEGIRCIRKTDEPLALPRSLNIPISISYLKIDENPIVLIFTASGWVRKDIEFTVHFKDKTETFTYKNS